MEEGLLSLKWNNHKITFFNLFQRLRQKGTCTDATLSCGQKFFNVHKLILMACSDFFCELFEHTMCQNPVVVLKDVKSTELEALLDYMYIGEVEVQQKNLPEIIKAAESLRIKGLAVPDDESISSQGNKDKTKERPYKRKRCDNYQNSYNERTPNEQSSSQNQRKENSSSPTEKGESKITAVAPHQQKDMDSLNRCNIDFQSSDVQSSLFDSSSLDFQNVNIKVEDYPQLIDNSLVKSEESDFELTYMNYHQRNDISSVIDSCSDAVSNDIQSLGLIGSGGCRNVPVSQHDSFDQPDDQFSLSTSQPSDSILGPQVNPNFKTSSKFQTLPHTGNPLASSSSIPFCPHCHRTFSDRYKRDRHLLIHTGEKPYRCPVCPYRASRKDPVVRHFRLRHRQATQQLLFPSTG